MAEEGPKAQPLSRRDLQEKIIARAWTDDDFRRKFAADPKGQFEEHLGTRLPEGLVMTVHEETPNSLHFVIPMKPSGEAAELSDEDLEKVAGGIDVTMMLTLIASVAAVVSGGASASAAAGAGWGKQ